MASKTFSKDDVISRVETRYDFLTARNLFNEWVASTGHKGDKNELSADDVKALASYLETSDDHAGPALSALQTLIGAKGAAGSNSNTSASASPAKEESKDEKKEAAAKDSGKKEESKDEGKGSKKDEGKGGKK